MTTGTQIARQHIHVLRDGAFVVDWGEGQVQDLMTGEFMRIDDSDFLHVIYNAELDILMRRGRVLEYNSQEVSLAPLPESGRRTLD